MSTDKKKKSPAPAADGSTKYVSIATGRFVTEAYARKYPTKVAEGVTKLPKGAVIVETAVEGTPANPSLTKPAKKAAKKATKKVAKKKTRLVKRKTNGKFAKKTAKGGNVRSDYIDAVPTPKEATAVTDAIAASTAAVAKKAKKSTRKVVNIDLGKTTPVKAQKTVSRLLGRVKKTAAKAKKAAKKVVAKSALKTPAKRTKLKKSGKSGG